MADLPKLALSIRQPWAWAILYAGKRIENRDWYCRQRGLICLHAAKGMTQPEYDEANRAIQRAVGRVDQAWLDRWLGVTAAPQLLERGGIVGTAEIVDCVERSDSPWFFGRYGIVFANVRPVPFVPVRGALGFFDWRRNLAMDRRDAARGTGPKAQVVEAGRGDLFR